MHIEALTVGANEAAAVHIEHEKIEEEKNIKNLFLTVCD